MGKYTGTYYVLDVREHVRGTDRLFGYICELPASGKRIRCDIQPDPGSQSEHDLVIAGDIVEITTICEKHYCTHIVRIVGHQERR